MQNEKEMEAQEVSDINVTQLLQLIFYVLKEFDFTVVKNYESSV